jgi:phage-related protein
MAGKDSNIGIKISTDIVDLKSGIKSIKEEISKADKDFQKATAGLDKWSTSSEGLEAKLNQLNTKLTSQKKSVELYKNEIEEVSKLEGDHSVQLQQLKEKLESAEIAVKKTEKEINHYSNSLGDVSKKEKEAETELGKLTKTISDQEAELKDLQTEYKDAVITFGKNSKEAKALKDDIKKLSNELEDNQKEVQYADKQLELLDDQFDETADSANKFSDGINGLKDLGSKVAGGLATITASVGALAGAFLATAEGTREFRNNMAKLETGFTEAGLTAEDASNTFKEMYSILGDEGQATEATAFLAKFADDEKELASATHTLTGIYATFGAALPLEGLTEAINHTSSLGSVQGNLADALEWSGINVDDFNAQLEKCSDEEERQALIMETLSGVYDGAADTYKEVNKDVIDSNKAQANLTETMAKLGEKAEPILTVVKDGFNQLLQEVLKLTENVDFEALAEKIKGAFAYFIDTIIPAIKDGFQWILDNKDVLIAGIVAIGTGMLAWNVVSIVQGVVGAIKAWTVATEGMTVAQRLLNLAMSANPIGIIITVITALVAAFVVLWNKSDAFREFWIGLWDKLKSAVSFVVDWIKENWETLVLFMMNPFVGLFKYLYDNFEGFRNVVDTVLNKVVQFFKDCWSKIKEAWSGVSTWFSDIGEKIVNAFKNIPSKISEFFSTAWNNVKNAWSTVSTFFTDIKDKIVNAFKELPAKMLTVGEDLVKGLWNGIKDMTSWITKKLEGFGDSVLSGIKNFFGIHSPSKVFQEIGHYLGEGLAIGIEDETDNVTNTAIEMGEAVVDGVKSTEKDVEKIAKETADLYAEGVMESGNTVKNHFNKLLNDIKTFIIDPEVKTKNLENALTKITSIVEKLKSTIGNYISSIVDLFSQSIQQQQDVLDYELEKFQKQKDEEYELAKDTHEKELQAQKDALAQGLLSEQQYNAKKQQLENALAEQQKKIEKEKRLAEEETLRRKNELAKKQFYAQKANDISQAIINGAQAIVKGFADLGPIGGAINAGVQGVITAAQIDIIAKQQFIPMLAKGGVVNSPTLAMIGEAGKEAVVPLENNTGWISELAGKISAIMQRNLSLSVPHPQLAYAGARNTTNNFTQIINAPKTPSRIELYRDSKNLLALKR